MHNVAVLERGAKLPMVCAKSGQPTDDVLVHEVHDSPLASWLFYVFGIWGFIAQLFGSDRVSVRVPISPESARNYRLANFISGFIVVSAGIVMLFVAPAFPAFITAVVFRWWLLRHLWVTVHLTGNSILIKGVSPWFLRALHEQAIKS